LRSMEEIAMNDAPVWLAALVALPGVVIIASFLRIGAEPLRRLAVTSAIAMVVASLFVVISPRLRNFSIHTSILTSMPGGEEVIRIDALSAALLPFAAGLWLLTVAVTPHAALDRRGLGRTAILPRSTL